jgi:hypothetical protein
MPASLTVLPSAGKERVASARQREADENEDACGAEFGKAGSSQVGSKNDVARHRSGSTSGAVSGSRRRSHGRPLTMSATSTSSSTPPTTPSPASTTHVPPGSVKPAKNMTSISASIPSRPSTSRNIRPLWPKPSTSISEVMSMFTAGSAPGRLSCTPAIISPRDRDLRMEARLQRLKRLVDYAEQKNALILLENLNKEPADAEMHYLAHTIEEWEWPGLSMRSIRAGSRTCGWRIASAMAKRSI